LTVECPRTEMFQLLFGGQLAPEQHGPLADHAATCAACHAVVEALVTQQGFPPQDPLRIATGTVIGGRFRIDHVLGRGGMGIVVAATHLELGNRVAIKFMRDDKLPSAGAAERFIREARAVVKLRTDHVCRVLDVARLDSGAPYIVMEFLEGVDLARTIAARPLPATIAVEYVMQAAVAVAEAHAAGIVHRDLKPANLFVIRRPDGGPLVKVLDFGIAKALSESESRLTLTRTMLGSPGYMSPEQFESPRDVDARADIWALGVTLYQLLSGRLPFLGRNQTETAVKIAMDPPPPLDVDPRLGAVVFRCLEKARGDRYQDVAALAADLVPFGGPRARRISATLSRVATQAITAATPAAQPIVLPQSPTAASVASQMITAPPPRPPPARDLAAGSRSSRALRTRTARFAAIAAIGLVIVAGIAIAVRAVGGRTDTVAVSPGSNGSAVPAAVSTAPAKRTASNGATQPPSTVAPRGEAAPETAPDKAAPDRAAPDNAAPDKAAPDRAAPDNAAPNKAARNKAAPSKAAPRDGKGGPSDGKGGPSDGKSASSDGQGGPSDGKGARRADMPGHPNGLVAAMTEACEQAIKPSNASTTPPKRIVACWCQLHDQAHARQAFAKITDPVERDAARRACATQGIELE